jgi:hypothetical protein
MNIKRQFQYQYKNFVDALYSLELPAWVNSRAIRASLLIVTLFFGSAYVIKTASSASSGYEIHRLESKVQTLQQEIDKLEVDLADNSSLITINKKLKETNMASISSLSFYQNNGQAVARR